MNYLKLLFAKNKEFKRRFTRKYFPNSDFGTNHLILHFTYHKCLTIYYNKILSQLSLENNFGWGMWASDEAGFNKKVLSEDVSGVYFFSGKIETSRYDCKSLVGSHFIRNPRDLVVSAYFYHMKATEKWCIDPKFNWTPLTSNPLFSTHVSSNKRNFPDHISYQDYLKSLDQDSGLVLEML